jgi:hypothetical protein
MTVALSSMGESATAMTIFDCRGREGRERSRTRVGRATVNDQPGASRGESRDAYGASVGVSGLEGGSGISISVGVAISKTWATHTDLLELCSVGENSW